MSSKTEFMQTVPCCIEQDGRKIAPPAFPVLLYCEGSLNDGANAAGVTRLFDLFLDH
jgi:hypothetical protein